jgi:hypothetical protein
MHEVRRRHACSSLPCFVSAVEFTASELLPGLLLVGAPVDGPAGGGHPRHVSSSCVSLT